MQLFDQHGQPVHLQQFNQQQPANHQEQHGDKQEQHQQEPHKQGDEQPDDKTDHTSDASQQRTAIHAAISGPGVMLHNRSSKPETYFFFDNYWNGNGTAGANFDHPMKSVHLAPRMCKFVSLPESFKGRVQRGNIQPATWVEFQVKASNDGAAHGDISLEQGCDGAATISSTDGTNRSNGFTQDIIKNAPPAAVVERTEHNGSKTKCIASTMGNWSAGPNHAAAEYEKRVVGQKKAYIAGGTGTDDVASHNMCLRVDFY
ncbi:hypothetical protein L228DRAFT_250540 [Xylona heveae TC161]|uniref:Uncharacterized protein n=1 Tax=Xylona heveae (strain CBS 132557 / TC161) TaxID=1328760 RepID=A0A165A8N3_XYLHT|nr:hypothetical protein L228DRAFT_250540 [Xylona heveae TC161]KZF20100.1 hypothetical protein L228DRAFT_250540 [Xylona heveae TC161]